MGRAWNGICYQSDADALAGFTQDIPSADASGIIAFTALPSINSGLINWSISHSPLTDALVTTRTGTTQLQYCNNEGLNQWPVQSIVFYLALIFAVFAGFRTGFRP